MVETKIILYHGSPNKIVEPRFGLGEERHDNGKGFYLTQDLQLAKEWAVCRPEIESGYVHKFELETKGLKVFDYEKENILCWLSELMQLGGLVIQWCAKSEKAFLNLKKCDETISVDYHEFNHKYNERDSNARIKMKELIDSDKNAVEKVFSTLV